MRVPEPCTISYVGDWYLVYPVLVYVYPYEQPGHIPVPGNEQYPLPGKNFYFISIVGRRSRTSVK